MNPSSSFHSCPDCFASYMDRLLHVGEELICSRCGRQLKKYGDPHSFQTAWAWATASLVFLFMANVTPIMVFDVSGNTQSNLMITGVQSLFVQGYWPLGLVVFFSAIVLPFLYLSAFWYLLAACCLKKKWPGLESTLALVELLMPWNLIPVFAVATLAAVVKLDQLGNIVWKAGALWIALLALSSLILMRLFDRALFQKTIEFAESSLEV